MKLPTLVLGILLEHGGQAGKWIADLYLMIPPWFARFALEKFKSREELCRALLAVNFLNSPSLLDLLSARIAVELINNPDYFGRDESGILEEEN